MDDLEIEDIDLSIKIIVVGNAQVGKTTLAIRFVKDVFTAQYKKTLGVDFLTKEKYIKKIDKEVKFYIWDSAGQDDLFALAKRYFRGADAALIVFSINDRDSFEKVKMWNQRIREERDNIPVALVMSKIDIRDDIKVNDNEAIELAKELGLKFFKVSSKNGINVDECFDYLAVEHFTINGYNSSGADYIENFQKKSKQDIKFNIKKNKNSDDIEEIPSGNQQKRFDINQNTEIITGFKLGTKDLEKEKKKKDGCC